LLNKNKYALAIQEGFSYIEYRELVSRLFANNKNTGTNHSEEYLNYTKMNIRRMDRLDKKAILLESTINFFKSYNIPTIWLTLTEGWCADAAQCLPYVFKITEQHELSQFKLILREWGPRPTDAQAIVDQAKKDKVGVKDAAIKALIDYEKNKNLQLWYKKDKGISLQQEILNTLHK